MGQRSQIYVRINGKLVVTNYYQWNYGERMVSRARYTIEWLDDYVKNDWLLFFMSPNCPSYQKQLSRICDTNFDMLDVAISHNIIKEWKEQFPKKPFKEVVFTGQDNNDGQLFIDVTDNGVKYAFVTSNEWYDKVLNPIEYMNRDENESWIIPTNYLTVSEINTCIKNCRWIMKNAQLMTVEELKEFINKDYSKEV